jgi:hypothetical protein
VWVDSDELTRLVVEVVVSRKEHQGGAVVRLFADFSDHDFDLLEAAFRFGALGH